MKLNKRWKLLIGMLVFCLFWALLYLFWIIPTFIA